ncbi:hypothetical protein [Rickettsia sp. TH2014]|uniref:RP439 family protein n=1 Tax=Rickettsia sp. TH2014 TaxID=1967503 RepID=UPI002115913A|nr:hypothetical protein [Rickettsia sp. TH2014]
MNKQIAHMVAQIRAKQLATKYSQNKVQEIIIEYSEQHPDISDSEMASVVTNNLQRHEHISVSINNYLKDQNLNDIGFPIKYNKTSLQLNMAKQWAEHQGEELISQIKSGMFYHELPNTIDPDKLPILQSSSDQEYWGNENSSVSSVLLSSIAASCTKEQEMMPGTATSFPFLNPEYELPNDLVPTSYPFASKNGMKLVGDYQYGAHRYFKEQLLFGPEDCSTAVGKATYLTTEQIQSINTINMQAAYNNLANEYHYKAITFLSGDVKDAQLKLIQPGDIYLVKGHTAMIATQPDNNSNITTLQFTRDIDTPEDKRLGGGLYDYNLCNKAKEIETGIYILRPDLEPIHESCSLSQLLKQIDLKYLTLFPEGPIDIPGDCRIFLENNDTTVIGDITEASLSVEF